MGVADSEDAVEEPLVDCGAARIGLRGIQFLRIRSVRATKYRHDDNRTHDDDRTHDDGRTHDDDRTCRSCINHGVGSRPNNYFDTA